MSHWEQRDFFASVRARYPEYFYKKRVLEVGSLNVNGTARDFFTDCTYVGIDVAEGPGVDIVCAGQDFRSPEPFDVVISGEMLEHNPYWRETWINMCALSSGLVVMTCAGRDRPEHGTTRSAPETSPLTVGLGWDWYENREPADFDGLCEGFSVVEFTENRSSCDTYALLVR